MSDNLAIGSGIAMMGVGLPMIGLTSPAVGSIITLGGVGLCVFGFRDRLFSKLRIENWPVHNALNLRITNRRVKSGLADSQLTLHSIKQWMPGRGQWHAHPFQGLPFPLYSDDIGLPHKTPRMFQLVEFKNKSQPIIRGSVNGAAKGFDLPCRGVWRFEMELRWAGDTIPIARCFEWTDQTLPKFCKGPH